MSDPEPTPSPYRLSLDYKMEILRLCHNGNDTPETVISRYQAYLGALTSDD